MDSTSSPTTFLVDATITTWSLTTLLGFLLLISSYFFLSRRAPAPGTSATTTAQSQQPISQSTHAPTTQQPQQQPQPPPPLTRIPTPPGSNRTSPRASALIPDQPDAIPLPYLRITNLIRESKPAVVIPNSRRPINIESRDVTGQMIIALRTTPIHPNVETLFSNKRRMFEMRFSLKLLNEPRGIIFLGGELPDKMKLGLATMILCKTLLGISQRLSSTLHASFGDDVERPHIVFPLWHAAERLVVSKAGSATCPLTMDTAIPESDEDRASRLRDMSLGYGRMHSGDTITFSFHSQYLDLVTWKVRKMGALRDLSLSMFWQTMPLRVIVYDVPASDSKRAHNDENRRFLLHFELKNTMDLGASTSTQWLAPSPMEVKARRISDAAMMGLNPYDHREEEEEEEEEDDDDESEPNEGGDGTVRRRHLEFADDHYVDGGDHHDTGTTSPSPRTSQHRKHQGKHHGSSVILSRLTALLRTPSRITAPSAFIRLASQERINGISRVVGYVEASSLREVKFMITVSMGENHRVLVFKTWKEIVSKLDKEVTEFLPGEESTGNMIMDAETRRKTLDGLLSHPECKMKWKSLEKSGLESFAVKNIYRTRKYERCGEVLFQGPVLRAITETRWSSEWCVVVRSLISSSSWILFFSPSISAPCRVVAIPDVMKVQDLVESACPLLDVLPMTQIVTFAKVKLIGFPSTMAKTQFETIVREQQELMVSTPSHLNQSRQSTGGGGGGGPTPPSSSRNISPARPQLITSLRPRLEELLPSTTLFLLETSRQWGTERLVLNSYTQTWPLLKPPAAAPTFAWAMDTIRTLALAVTDLIPESNKQLQTNFFERVCVNLRQFRLREWCMSWTVEGSIAFYLNLRNTLAAHARLLLTLPDSKREMHVFKARASYMLGSGDEHAVVLSLHELDESLLMVRDPDLLLPPMSESELHHFLRIKKKEPRLNLVLRDGPRRNIVFDEDKLNVQLDEACAAFLDRAVTFDVEHKEIMVSKAVRNYFMDVADWRRVDKRVGADVCFWCVWGLASQELKLRIEALVGRPPQMGSGRSLQPSPEPPSPSSSNGHGHHPSQQQQQQQQWRWIWKED